MAREKPHLNIVFIGHVDHGKSTTIGRLFYDLGLIDERTLEEYRKEAEEKGKVGFEFAYVMDRLKEERERGITIDIAYRDFETKKYYFTIIDAPGHQDFVKNMITGASQADAAVLVVAAPEGIMPQTREHAILAKTLGINQIIVFVNKMDMVNYDKAKFEQLKEELMKFLQGIGYRPEQIKAIIPGSALKGDNVVKKSENMPWYNGPTLYEAFDLLEEPPRPIDKPLRIPIEKALSIKGVGTVLTGRVESGILRPGDKIILQPIGLTGEVKSIEMHHQPLNEARPGDNIGFNVKGIGKDDVKRGDVVGHVDNPPTVAERFTAQVIVLYHPTAITAGYTPVFHIHTAQVAATFDKLLKKMDPRTGQVVEENPQFLKTGDAALVEIVPTKPVVVEKFQDFPALGRFAVRDMSKTVAVGIVKDVVPRSK
ncbi:MAG: translation elongation factor EF-1 subunit alpha [Candidatus Diapherotrites archaeon]|nr:translation elongation factor EF-1 subunit alpha [Candidatus Diapherotrites archaeon]